VKVGQVGEAEPGIGRGSSPAGVWCFHVSSVAGAMPGFAEEAVYTAVPPVLPEPLMGTPAGREDASLDRLLEREIDIAVPEAIAALAAELRRRYGSSVAAILYYGSCLRQGEAVEGVVDLYVLTDSYRGVLGNRFAACAAFLLPPTVKYLQLDTPVGELRCKYAILSLAQFRRGTSRRWFQSYLWGRFAQPSVLVYVRDAASRGTIVRAIASAVQTLLGNVVPLMPEELTARELWVRAIDESYRTELRAEAPGRAGQIVASTPEHYENLTRLVAGPIGLEPLAEDAPAGERRYRHRRAGAAGTAARLAWPLRRLTGKLLSVLRWLKALFTFSGGVDYAVWKLERHTGIKVELSPRARRHPWLFLWPELWRLYRSGALR
jgi:hypothetical protein